MILKKITCRRTIAVVILITLLFSLGMSFTTVLAEESAEIPGGNTEGTTEGAIEVITESAIEETSEGAIEEPTGTPMLLGTPTPAKSYSTNLVIITGTTSWVNPLVQGYHNLIENRDPAYEFGLKIYSGTDVDYDDAKLQETIKNADAVVFQMIGDDKVSKINKILSNSWNEKWKDSKAPAIFTNGCSADYFSANIVKDVSITPNEDTDDFDAVTKYCNKKTTDNCEKLFLFLASKYGDGDVTTTEDLTPITTAKGSFAYHPSAAGTGIFSTPEDYYNWYQSRSEYNPSAPWVGIMDRDSSYDTGNYDLITETIKALEKKGINVIPVFTTTDKINTAKNFFYRDLDGDGSKEPAIDTFICPMGFSFDSSTEKTITLFKEMNVPVLSPIYASDLEKWENDPAGTASQLYYNVALPELEGRIEPIFMGGSKNIGMDEATGAIITKNVALEDRIERVAGRAANWAELRKSENKDKKIAIFYYNMDGGKDNLGCTTLNVPRSLAEVFNAMKNKGYILDTDGALSTDGKITEEKVFTEMFQKGRNIGGWAPGELETFASQDGIIKVDLDTYLGWYNKLPAKLREAVEEKWGPAPGNFMVQDNKIIIPGIISGNVYFGPQPMRGWGEDVNNITHSPTLPPSHQYLAQYFWLQNEFGADALIHFGTHGSMEWLPGKSVGLSGEDWTDIVQGDMPNIYPYVVNNPGEGAQAKRRGYAVLVDYLTAALANTQLYGNLLELHNLAHQYEFASNPANNQPAADAEKIKERITTLIKLEELDKTLGLGAMSDFSSMLDKVHEYLDEVEADVTPLGLHTFGVAPQDIPDTLDDPFEKMVQAIISFDPENRSALADTIRENLRNTTEEMDMLLLSLNAGYIPPGMGHDPIRDPSIMPTGKNIVSFDPRTTPDKVSWEIGKKCADNLVSTYYAEHGSYPESVGVVLWAIETMRDGGQGIAMTMRLMGIEPKWDASGKVTGYKVTPVEELGRPRIDVVISASSLFRDTFSNVMTLLDKAVRELAENESDSNQNNYIKKHFETLKSQYISQGKGEDEAAFLAASRVFSAMPGTQGNGVAERLEATSSWNTSEDVVETFLSRASYIYGTDKNGNAVYGQAGLDTFKDVLKNVQATVHVIDSTYGSLDNDDIAGDLGGLTLAAKWASGKDVQAYIANTRFGISGSKIQTIQQFVAQELYSRMLNPQFVKEMMKEGYQGSETLAAWFGNTLLVDTTLNAVDDKQWHDLAATYIFDESVKSQLDPYCLQSMIGWAAEAARKGMWQASKEDLTKLSDTYIQSMVKNGVVCCHHTCGNIVFNEWVAEYSSLDKDTLKQFESILSKATNKNVNIKINEPSKPTNNESKSETPTTVTPEAPKDTATPEPTEPTPTPETKNNAVSENANQAAAREQQKDNTVVADNSGSAGKQPQAVTAETGEKAKETITKAYEISEKENSQSSTGTKAVAAAAIVAAIVIVGIFLKGYLSFGIKKTFKK